MKKTLMLMSALFVTSALSITAFAADVPPVSNPSTVSSTATTAAKPGTKSFKAKFADSFNELNNLRTECKNLLTSIKASNESLKSEWKNFKETLKGKNKAERKTILTNLKTNITPLRDKSKNLGSDIKTLRTEKTASWMSFKEAVKAKDEVKASTALNNIIDLKKQIIDKEKSLLETRQEISGLIK